MATPFVSTNVKMFCKQKCENNAIELFHDFKLKNEKK